MEENDSLDDMTGNKNEEISHQSINMLKEHYKLPPCVD